MNSIADIAKERNKEAIFYGKNVRNLRAAPAAQKGGLAMKTDVNDCSACTPICECCLSTGAIPFPLGAITSLVRALAEAQDNGLLQIAMRSVVGDSITPAGVRALLDARDELDGAAAEHSNDCLERIPAICRRRVEAASRYEPAVHPRVTEAARDYIRAYGAFSAAAEALRRATADGCPNCANSPAAPRSMGGNTALCQRCATTGPNYYRAIPAPSMRRNKTLAHPTHEEALADPFGRNGVAA